MSRALIIDDLPERHAGFDKHFSQFEDWTLDHAWSPDEAISFLRAARWPFETIGPNREITSPEPWSYDLIFLDHDNRKGADFIHVVRFIMNNPDIFVTSPKFMVHSGNSAAAIGMESDLRVAGYNVERCKAPTTTSSS